VVIGVNSSSNNRLNGVIQGERSEPERYAFSTARGNTFTVVDTYHQSNPQAIHYLPSLAENIASYSANPSHTVDANSATGYGHSNPPNPFSLGTTHNSHVVYSSYSGIVGANANTGTNDGVRANSAGYPSSTNNQSNTTTNRPYTS
jgi:hypothetical protein